MRLLILGYSSIVERRVLPAAAKVEAIEQISIASRSRTAPGAWPKQGRFFNGAVMTMDAGMTAV